MLICRSIFFVRLLVVNLIQYDQSCADGLAVSAESLGLGSIVLNDRKNLEANLESRFEAFQKPLRCQKKSCSGKGAIEPLCGYVPQLMLA
jgi:hypothetical protein